MRVNYTQRDRDRESGWDSLLVDSWLMWVKVDIRGGDWDRACIHISKEQQKDLIGCVWASPVPHSLLRGE